MMHMSEGTDTVDARTTATAEISAAMIRLYKDLFGRGPTRARTYWAGPDTVVVFLEDTLTATERNLVRMGEQGRLRDTRMFFQYASIEDFCRPIEAITGRKVRSFLSGIDPDTEGTCVEAFVLHPPEYDGPSRADGPAADAGVS